MRLTRNERKNGRLAAMASFSRVAGRYASAAASRSIMASTCHGRVGRPSAPRAGNFFGGLSGWLTGPAWQGPRPVLLFRVDRPRRAVSCILPKQAPGRVASGEVPTKAEGSCSRCCRRYPCVSGYWWTPVWERPLDQRRLPYFFNVLRMENGSPGGTRTPDLVVNSHPLYRLSYRGTGEIVRARGGWGQCPRCPETVERAPSAEGRRDRAGAPTSCPLPLRDGRGRPRGSPCSLRTRGA